MVKINNSQLNDFTEFNLDKCIDVYQNSLLENFRVRDYFYASEIGKSLLEIYETFKNQQPPHFDSRVKRILENGNYVHMRFQKLFAEMKILIAAEIQCNTDLIHGRCDALITDGHKNYVVDIKSCSSSVFKMLNEAKEQDILQLLFYMHTLHIYNGILLYENKDTQQIKSFNIAFDEQKIQKRIEELQKIKDAVQNDVPLFIKY